MENLKTLFEAAIWEEDDADVIGLRHVLDAEERFRAIRLSNILAEPTSQLILRKTMLHTQDFLMLTIV